MHGPQFHQQWKEKQVTGVWGLSCEGARAHSQAARPRKNLKVTFVPWVRVEQASLYLPQVTEEGKVGHDQTGTSLDKESGWVERSQVSILAPWTDGNPCMKTGPWTEGISGAERYCCGLFSSTTKKKIRHRNKTTQQKFPKYTQIPSNQNKHTSFSLRVRHSQRLNLSVAIVQSCPQEEGTDTLEVLGKLSLRVRTVRGEPQAESMLPVPLPSFHPLPQARLHPSKHLWPEI